MPIVLDNRSISRADDRALHRQLADLLRNAISGGQLRPGEPLPSEAELSSTTGVSRTAVRDALNILANEELIVKHPGTMTRVATPPPVRHMATSRYAEEMAILRAGGPHPPTSAFTVDHGIEWSEYTVAATYAEDAATDVDAEALALTPGDAVLRRHLIKFVAGEPVQVQDSVIPLALVAGTPVADPARQPWRGGTLAELYSVGLVVTKVIEEARARPPSTAERKALEMVAAGPVLEIVRVFHVEHRPVEFSTAVVPAARNILRFETELKR